MDSLRTLCEKIIKNIEEGNEITENRVSSKVQSLKDKQFHLNCDICEL